MHRNNQTILQNLYSKYVNLPSYKKLFFPRRFAADLHVYINDIDNKEKAVAVCNSFLNYTGFF